MGGGPGASRVPAADEPIDAGSIALDDGALVLTGDIDDRLCADFRTAGVDLAAVDCVDARRVTLLASAGLALLAAVARARGTGVPLWAGQRAVLGPLRMTGLDHLFDLRAPH